MPNLNAALGCAQREGENLLAKKGKGERNKAFFAESEYQFVEEPKGSVSNYWLNACYALEQSRETN